MNVAMLEVVPTLQVIGELRFAGRTGLRDREDETWSE
jgi:hypothetical protein